MRKFGVKLWSGDFAKNPEFAKQSVRTVKEGYFDYIELFALPDTYEDYHQQIATELKDLKVIIHAPHAVFGLDTGNKDLYEQNLKKLKSSQQFADLLKAEMIILHPGFHIEEQYFEETIRQFKMINDCRLTVENLPVCCGATGNKLHGTSPEQIKRIIEETDCQFCLDFAHAICAANSSQRDVWQDLAAYQSLNPVMYHMCDGDFKSIKDEHRHYGKGNYPLAELLNNYTNPDTFITMETGHGIPTTIQPWLDDITYLKSLLKK